MRIKLDDDAATAAATATAADTFAPITEQEGRRAVR